GGDQRVALLPVLGGGVGLDQLGIAAVAAQQRAFLLRERILERRGAEREPRFGRAIVLVLGVGARRLGEGHVVEQAADARDVAINAVEHAAAFLVAVEPLGDVVAQVTA